MIGRQLFGMRLEWLARTCKTESMQTVSLESAQAELPKLLKQLGQQEQLIITEHGQPLATVTKADLTAARPRVFGCCQGEFEYHDGWDSPEEDFEPYAE